jgi:hypothetical protein
MVISRVYIQDKAHETVGEMLSQMVAGKKILSDDKINDMLNYTIGTIKCFSTAKAAV